MLFTYKIYCFLGELTYKRQGLFRQATLVQNLLDKYRQFIEDKTTKYLQQLDCHVPRNSIYYDY
jgi:hypothetical protein